MRRSLKLSQLDALSAVIRLGSVTEASKELHRTQPAISISVKQLEDYYQIPLMEVVNKKLYPTPAGLQVVTMYEKIDSLLEAVEQDFQLDQKTLKGVLSIAMVSSGKYFVPRLVGQFVNENPDVEPHLDILNRQDVLSRLIDNRCDFAVLSQVPKQLSLETKLIGNNPLVMIAAKDHWLAKRKKIRFRDLKDEKFILREVGSGIRYSIESLFKKNRITPNISMELSSTEGIKEIVAANMGISLVPKISIQTELSLKKLVILDVMDLPVHKSWYVVYPKSKKLSRLADMFIGCLKSNSTGS